MSTLERAIAIACEAHAGQIDKGGQPYILHPLRVMMAMQSEKEQIVAVLHDVLEDCPFWTKELLIKEGFSQDIVTAIEILTKPAGSKYDDYLTLVAHNTIARTVKMGDISDNIRPERLPQPLTEADNMRLDKYNRALMVLREAGGGG